jgi:hypothetical protein
MQAEHAVRPGSLLRRFDRAPHLVARIGDQSRQACRRPILAVCAGNGAHRIRGRAVVEEHAAAAIDL